MINRSEGFSISEGKIKERYWWERNSNRMGSEGYDYNYYTLEQYTEMVAKKAVEDYKMQLKHNAKIIEELNQPLLGKDLFNGKLTLKG